MSKEIPESSEDHGEQAKQLEAIRKRHFIELLTSGLAQRAVEVDDQKYRRGVRLGEYPFGIMIGHRGSEQIIYFALQVSRGSYTMVGVGSRNAGDRKSLRPDAGFTQKEAEVAARMADELTNFRNSVDNPILTRDLSPLLK